MSQQINLYEARLRPRHELAVARNLGICTLLVLVLMTALAQWASFEAKQKGEASALSQQRLRDEQEKLKVLTQKVAQRRVSPALVADLDSAKAKLAVSTELIGILDSGTLGNTSGFAALMNGFARQSASDVWLTGFVVTQGGVEIEIRGRLLDPTKLPAYVQRLSSEPVFQGRRFAALEVQGVDPDEQKADQPGVTKVPEAKGGAQSAVRSPRFVEFVLRSENAGGTEAMTRAGGGKR
ncbi:hypothetical protein [Propionivibrio sp.]|uniref:hypothetical protein n=1 Tax=Propionivibrio sp. TaxID=2212460 RepID=UPI0026032A74|nr:hypothetical protein [Propionivibrio sp.]